MKRFYQEQRLNANSIIYTSAIRPRENPEFRSQISSAEEQEHLAIPRQEANQLTAQQCTRVTVAIQSVRDTRNVIWYSLVSRISVADGTSVREEVRHHGTCS